MTEHHFTVGETPVDQTLFGGQIKTLVLTFYQNERPPCGLLGLMDWHFHGEVSKSVRSGAITGQLGECSYLPLRRKNSVYHLLLVGAGPASSPGERIILPTDALDSMRKNLSSLKFEKVGISRSDFGNPTAEVLAKHLKGIPLWIGP
ncbi:MAG: hypothetical protein HYX41_00975 [Bdellovibrio sp.]|nr:hypothetical protein [Bdellovibrio sp.]